MTIEDVLYVHGSVQFDAREFRRQFAAQFKEGILGSTSFQVLQRGAGPNFSVDVLMGLAVIDGDDQANQGSYLVRSTATENIAVTAAPGSNSRYDIVVLRVNDPTAGGAAGNNATITVIAGTPAASPTVPATPPSAIRLATIGPIATATASITNAIIADTRPIARSAHEIVDTAAIAFGAVTDAKLSTGLDASKLTVGTLPIARIADGDVTNAKLASGIDAAKITTGTLPIARIADGTVTSAKIADGTIVTADIADAQITTAKVADGNVTEAKLAAAVLSSAWTGVTYNGAWSAGTGGVVGLQYKKVGNVVHLVGTAIRASGGGSVCTLPAGFRPSAIIRDVCYSGSILNCAVDSAGAVTVTGASDGSNVSINMIIPV